MSIKKWLSDSRVRFLIGMACLLVFNVSHYSTRWIDGSWRDAVDGFSGVALGAAIALLLLASRARGRGVDSCA